MEDKAGLFGFFKINFKFVIIVKIHIDDVNF